MRWFVAVAASLLLAYGCANRQKVPAGIIPRDQMQTILWDMIQADQFALQFLVKDSVKNKHIREETFKLYEEVFQVHHISRDDFLKSYRFYLSRPDMMRTMLDTLNSRAQHNRDSFYRPIKPLEPVKLLK